MGLPGPLGASDLRGLQPVTALPQRKAVSLAGRAEDATLRLKDPSGLQLRLNHQASAYPSTPFVLFNLWADLDEGFFSPEPWVGLQNALNSRRGLVELQPGESWQWKINIDFLDGDKTATG